MKASFKRYATALLLAGGVLAAQESPKFPPVNATTQVCSDTADSRRLANDTHGGQKTGQVWYFNVPTASVEGTRVPLNLGEQDKVQIHICNNPFLYTYVLETPETAIQSDDVVGKIFSSLGLSTTNSDSSTKAGSSKPEATGGTTAPYAVANKPFELINHGFSDTGTTPPACAVDKLRKAAADLTQATVTLQRVEGSMSAKALTQEGKDNETNLSVGATNYLKARKNFVTQFNEFLNDRIGGPALKDRVSALVGGTLASYNELASPSLETSLLQNARESTRAANNVRDAKDALDAQISQATKLGQCSTKGVTRKDAKPLEDAKKEFDTAYANATTVQKDAKVITESLKSAVSQAVYNTCVYLHRKNHEYKSMLDNEVTPLTEVLENADNFETSRREGPFSEPTDVKIILHRTATDQKTLPAAADATGVEAFTCETNADDAMQDNQPLLSLDDVMKASGNDRAMAALKEQGSKGKDSKGDNTGGKASGTEDIVLTQPVSFGGPRLTLSGGLMVSGLRNQEFQRTSTLDSNGNAITVIGYKTNSRVRVLPMVFGNVRLFRIDIGNWNTDAAYLSLGLTAHANDKGTSPEFFVGPSVSLARNRFYLSGGAYLGKQQSLAGGLKPGQTLPSGFTSDIPVSNSYKAGWGIGLSYRFNIKGGASDNSPQQPKDTAKPKTKQKGGSAGK